jgi:hypothetical protein
MNSVPRNYGVDVEVALKEVVCFGRTKAVIAHYDEADLLRKRGSAANRKT